MGEKLRLCVWFSVIGDSPHRQISKAPPLRPFSGERRKKEMLPLGRDLWRDRGNQTLETATAELRGRTQVRCSKATTGSRREELLGEERQVGGTPSCLSLKGARDRSDERSWSRALQMIFRRRDPDWQGGRVQVKEITTGRVPTRSPFGECRANRLPRYSTSI